MLCRCLWDMVVSVTHIQIPTQTFCCTSMYHFVLSVTGYYTQHSIFRYTSVICTLLWDTGIQTERTFVFICCVLCSLPRCCNHLGHSRFLHIFSTFPIIFHHISLISHSLSVTHPPWSAICYILLASSVFCL